MCTNDFICCCLENILVGIWKHTKTKEGERGRGGGVFEKQHISRAMKFSIHTNKIYYMWLDYKFRSSLLCAFLFFTLINHGRSEICGRIMYINGRSRDWLCTPRLLNLLNYNNWEKGCLSFSYTVSPSYDSSRQRKYQF